MTAGNSTPLTDGASAVLLGSQEWADAHGLTPLAWFVDGETAAVDYVHGDEGLLSFMNTRAILVDRGKADYDPIWYPYKDKLAAAFDVFRGVATKSIGKVIKGFLGLRKASIDGHKSDDSKS